MTNADRIRAMTDEQLAYFLFNVNGKAGDCQMGYNCK